MKATEKVALHSEATLLDSDTKQKRYETLFQRYEDAGLTENRYRHRAYLVLLPDKLIIANQNGGNPSKFT